jgi:hypothetical protein
MDAKRPKAEEETSVLPAMTSMARDELADAFVDEPEALGSLLAN